MHFGRIVGNQDNKKRIRALYILKLLYAGCSPKRSRAIFSIAEHLNLQKINYFCACSLGRSQQIKIKPWYQDIKHFEIAIYRVFRERCNSIGSFAEHLEFQKKVTFTQFFFLWANSWEEKLNKNNKKNSKRFETATSRVLHKQSNSTAPFTEHLKFQKYMTFTESFWVNSGKSKEES